MGVAVIREPTSEDTQVRALLCDLSRLLLKWSWEGVVGYEEMVELVGREIKRDTAQPKDPGEAFGKLKIEPVRADLRGLMEVVKGRNQAGSSVVGTGIRSSGRPFPRRVVHYRLFLLFSSRSDGHRRAPLLSHREVNASQLVYRVLSPQIPPLPISRR